MEEYASLLFSYGPDRGYYLIMLWMDANTYVQRQDRLLLQVFDMQQHCGDT